MSDAAEREWRFYIDDMITFAQKVLSYTDGLDQSGLCGSTSSPRTKSTTCRSS